ncbi:MAG: hypothetical protein Q8Q09_19380 [Deltaproteobacteria bacterium]|nr:hypothetical protein [Deltaproteobacteria bacterium]
MTTRLNSHPWLGALALFTLTACGNGVVPNGDASRTDAAGETSLSDTTNDTSVSDAAEDTSPLDAAGDATADSNTPCPGEQFSCAEGVSGGQCGDLFTRAICRDGRWQCERGIPASECACVGRPPPGCVCTPRGYNCADAGTDAGPRDASMTDSATDARSDATTGTGPVTKFVLGNGNQFKG